MLYWRYSRMSFAFHILVFRRVINREMFFFMETTLRNEIRPAQIAIECIVILTFIHPF